MKAFLPLVLIAGAGFAAVYHFSPRLRETVSTWNLLSTERETFNAYREGKAIFLAKWSGDPHAQFAAWGDDPSVTAKPVRDNIWLATGKLTSGTPGSSPWLVVFERGSNDAVTWGVGPAASTALERINKGEEPHVAAKSESTPERTPILIPRLNSSIEHDRRGSAPESIGMGSGHAGQPKTTPVPAGNGDIRKAWGWDKANTSLDQKPPH
jgi:hypothetical protein